MNRKEIAGWIAPGACAAGVFASILMVVAFSRPREEKIDRTPMLLVLTRHKDLMAEIECYVGPGGDPVWHGEAIAYGSDGQVELAKAQFRDGRFISGRFADGERPATPERIYHLKRVISCEHFEHMSAKLIPWPKGRRK